MTNDTIIVSTGSKSVLENPILKTKKTLQSHPKYTMTSTATQTPASRLAALTQLKTDTEVTLEGLKNPLIDLGRLEQKVQEAAKEPGANLRAAQMRVTQATLNTAIQAANEQERQFPLVFASLNAIMTGLGEEIKAVEAMTPEEKGRIAAAEQAIADAKQKLGDVQKGWFAGLRTPGAKTALEAAQTALEDVKNAVAQAGYDRLIKADFAKQAQNFTVMSDRVLGLLGNKQKEAQQHFDIAASSLAQAEVDQKDAAGRLTELQKKVTDLQAQLAGAEQERAGLEVNTPAWADANSKVTQITGDLKIAEAESTTASSDLQSAEQAIETFKTAKSTFTTLKQTIVTWISRIKTDTEHRRAAIANRLAAKRVGAALEFVGQYHDVGQKLDGQNLEVIAQVGVGAERRLLDALKFGPEQFKKLQGIWAAQQRAATEFRKEYDGINAQMVERYGINPAEFDITTFYDEAAQAAEQSAAA